MRMRSFSSFGLLLCLLLLSACASDRGSSGTSSSAPVTANPHYKVGQPYQIKGEWYYPKEDYSYDETGIASWYGEDFHGKLTANGEVYNKNELTAAHNTLPMPSLARVTNLDNGRSIVVRINDRGPFARSRIIDVTQRVAQLLGFEQQGTAKVRVQVLADESRAIADAMRRYGSNSITVANAPATAPIDQVSSTPISNSSQHVEVMPLPSTPSETRQAINTVRPLPEVKQLPLEKSTQIFVQAGAFTQVSNAERLKAKLATIGSTSISEFTKSGTTFYRVRVGPLANVGLADQTLKRVLKAGTENARIIID